MLNHSNYSNLSKNVNTRGLSSFHPVVDAGEGAGSFLAPVLASVSSSPHPESAIFGDENSLSEMGKVLDLAEDPAEGWRGRGARQVLTDAWAEWASGLCDWKSFITLTFERERFPDVARSLFRWWVRVNNSYVFGKRYTRKVGHSYFSYLCGMEFQKREVVHFHVLVDKPINYSLTHNAWGDRCGFAWIDGKLKDKASVLDYVCKYVMKGGEIDIYQAKKSFTPDPTPTWWRDAISKDLEVAAVKGAGNPAAPAGSPALAKPLTALQGQFKLESALQVIM